MDSTELKSLCKFSNLLIQLAGGIGFEPILAESESDITNK